MLTDGPDSDTHRWLVTAKTELGTASMGWSIHKGSFRGCDNFRVFQQNTIAAWKMTIIIIIKKEKNSNIMYWQETDLQLLHVCLSGVYRVSITGHNQLWCRNTDNIWYILSKKYYNIIYHNCDLWYRPHTHTFNLVQWFTVLIID